MSREFVLLDEFVSEPPLDCLRTLDHKNSLNKNLHLVIPG